MARLAYLGTPELAVAPLEALVEAGHQVVQVVSRPDRRRGRGSGLSPSPVKEAALRLGLAVSDRLDDLATSPAELAVVVAYGRLVPAVLLERLPMVNLHFSLLPRWRGAAPVERAILAGDEVTGVCAMALEAALDTGPVYRRTTVPIEPGEHLAPLRHRLVQLGSGLLVDLLADGLEGLPEPEPQQGEATYAEKIDPAELELAWAAPAEQLARVVRLDRAWTTLSGRRLRVLEAQPTAETVQLEPGQVAGELVGTGQGLLRLVRVQPEGKAPMAAADWVRGARLATVDRLGS